MAEIVMSILLGGCCVVGVAFLFAAIGRKQIIRLSPKQRHMIRPVHLIAAMLFVGIPLQVLCRRLPIWVVIAYLSLSAVVVIYGCVTDVRYRRACNTG